MKPVKKEEITITQNEDELPVQLWSAKLNVHFQLHLQGLGQEFAQNRNIFLEVGIKALHSCEYTHCGPQNGEQNETPHHLWLTGRIWIHWLQMEKH